MSSKSPSPEGSDTDKDNIAGAEKENGDGEEDTVGIRESADGGASPPEQKQTEDSATGAKSTEDSGSAKEQSGDVKDLDKDIDAVLENNVNNGHIYPDLSVTIDSIPVDSTLDATKNEEDTGADGMPPVTITERQQYLGNSTDENGNIEQAEKEKGSLETEDFLKVKEVSSEKSFTSDTDSSVVAETLVRNALNIAVTTVRDEQSASGFGELKEDENVTEDRIAKSNAKQDVKVGLFQYDFGDDYQAENGGYEDEDTDEKDDEKDIRHVVTGDSQVGLFQYTDVLDTENKIPNFSDMEETAEDQADSMTEEERADIMKLYGLDGDDPLSPKSPTENKVPEFEPENADVRVIDVQREVYEPQTRNFMVTRDPSSSESTPRNGIDGRESDRVEKVERNSDKDNERPSPRGSEKDERVSDKEESVLSDSSTKAKPVGELKADIAIGNDGNTSVHRDASLSQDISPPLVQYEPVKENGKFRIIKTSKEGGGSSYSTIRVGKDLGTPEQSPRSESEQSQKSDSSQPVVRAKEYTSSQQSITLSIQPLRDEQKQPNALSGQQAESGRQRQADKEYDGYRGEIQHTTSYRAGSDKATSSSPLSSQRIQDGRRQGTEDSFKADSSVSWKARQDIPGGKSSLRGRPEEGKVTSPRQLSVSELHDSPREIQRSEEYDRERIRYTTRNTDGVEIKRTGPVPYDVTTDKPRSPGRYVDSQYTKPYSKDRYDGPHDDPAGRFSASYKEELIQSAYDRLPTSQDVRSKSLPGRTVDSSVIPGFRTLQEQQASWGTMFRQLEDQHRREMRSQYDRHQYNIQRLQQQMELELQKQHAAIRKKLDIHREKLDQMTSPDRGSPGRGSRIPEREDRSPSGSRDRPNRSRDLEDDFTIENKTWREIYREVRAEEDERDSSSPLPLKRSLDDDFATLDSTRDDSRSKMKHSPRDLKRSPYSPKSRDRDHSGDRSRSFERSKEFSRSEGERSRGDGYSTTGTDRDKDFSRAERESRSRSCRSDASPRRDGDDSKAPQTIGQFAAENVSQHIQQLLDNLQDTRTSLRNIEGNISQDRGQGLDRPRAGVYSSPMPMFKGAAPKSSPKTAYDKHSATRESQSPKPVDMSRISTDTSRLSADQSRLSSLFEDRAELHEDSLYPMRDSVKRDKKSESMRGEDLTLSSRERLNLREKHSKHLADLRAYYEDEVRELRKALTESLDSSQLSADVTVQSTVQGQLLEAENKHLLDKCRTMEDELEELYSRVRVLEQKNQGLETRANKYSSAFTESKTMAIQHQAHIEELQRYCRERDDVITNLESKISSQEDSVKIYKKSLDEELELHRQDKIALQRIIDKYESLEREYKLLQETMSTTETKLYEARTDVVELNRTMSKLELENKRIGRENDNLRHKITQSLNLSALHESFGSPTSPRSASVGRKSPVTTSHHQSPLSLTSQSQSTPSRPATSSSNDQRVPGFATSSRDWSSSTQHEKSKSNNASKLKSASSSVRSYGQGKHSSSESLNASHAKAESSKSKRRDDTKRSNSSRSSAPREEGRAGSSTQKRSQHMNGDVEHEPTRDYSPPGRDITPPRPPSVDSLQESEASDFSPLLKAERELFKLRDMMRQAVAVKPSPPEPKLQKKFYGSERPSSRDDYHPDLSSGRGRKEKPAISNHTVVAKTKPGPQQSKSDRSVDKSKKSSRSDKSMKSKDRAMSDRDSRERIRDEEDQRAVTPPQRHGKPGVYESPTRFDININDQRKTVSVSQRKAESKSSTMSRANQTGEETHGSRADRGDTNGAHGPVESTLDKVRNGQFLTRPEWEDVFTSLTKPKPESQETVKSMTKEEKIKDRLKMISEMESRYDGLQAEKRQLESSLTKIPLHGRVDRSSRQQKEVMEDRLDNVEKELGSLRMSLKRYNVLKTAG